MKDDYAFPRVTQLGQMAPGMELRDWFAGMAMSGILANPEITDYASDKDVSVAYKIADLMIKYRNNKKEQ
jgi:hypothetical protein